jgi:hypothetical protein
MVENRRRAVAESNFELGETDKAEALFEQWLAADRRWGWGWIGWADLHFFTNTRPKDYTRADELLRRGYSTPGIRDQVNPRPRRRPRCQGSREFPRCDHGNSPSGARPVSAGRSAAMASRWRRMR